MTKKITVSQAVKTGDFRLSLETLRDRLAVDIDNPDTPPAIRAQLAKQIQSVLHDLESIPDPQKDKGTVLDDLLNGGG